MSRLAKPGIEILAADEGSIPALARLHAAAFDDPWDEASMAGVLSMSGAFGLMAVTAAADARRPLLLAFLLARLAADEGEILTVAVAPERRGEGLGRLLMERAAAGIQAAGGRSIFLEVAEDNAPALRLYAGLGYHTVGFRPGYYRRGAGVADARVMRLTLPPLLKKP